MDPGDVGMVERRQRLRLALEAGQPLAVRGDRRLAAQARVGGAEHLAHAALAELRGDLVGAQTGADHWTAPGVARPVAARAPCQLTTTVIGGGPVLLVVATRKRSPSSAGA